MTAKSIMIQGTGSDVGKSVITAGLCRLLVRDGYQVAPFKSQNMALNSFITRDGGEIGRAQAVQAEAARVVATVDMNPVLLKPNQDDNSQLIIHGQAVKNIKAKEYFSDQGKSLEAIEESLQRLVEEWEIIVMEGAGSPAEINLREYDLVNMKIAEMIDAPVILVADIDKGGVFASIVGTLELLTQEERERVKGIIINKFRGDQARFEGGIDFIEKYTGKPVLGVIPYLKDIKIPEEDSLAQDIQGDTDYQLDIVILYLPHISNFTDFDLLAAEPETRVRYLRELSEIGEPDLIIIPGSKNTIEDLQYLYSQGYIEVIRQKYRQGIPVLGICGGYQMLGRRVIDPAHVESSEEVVAGLGLLEMETVYAGEKISRQVKASINTDISFFKDLQGEVLTGYEIHHGRGRIDSDQNQLLKIMPWGDKGESFDDGLISDDGLVWGTYLHGIFDNDRFRRFFINYLRAKKGLRPLSSQYISSRRLREDAYDRFADLLEKNIVRAKLDRVIFG
ncbi:cobyric acid synthase [Iocasia frigidifontis]|uniref:Cobyric acid synthase n=1 Tax=Iocasia fonsfrigidae TaxID=2682810 RepID=A0A8A7KGE9_9FIRM|nr:cobyric acid synthase [Iocasia fonsfrigidae]QTL98788.1 cobyric acid synthase [Iocasia fonsfrigidae]